MKNKIFLTCLLSLHLLGSAQIFATSLQENREIFNTLMNEELQKLSHLTGGEKAAAIGKRIGKIAKMATERGFDPSLYSYGVMPKTGYLSFSSHPLWEGREQLPVTFRIYVWPTENMAKSRSKKPDDRENAFYRSNVHSHPIPCALTVMQGSVLQRSFARDENCLPIAARLVGEKKLQVGDQEVDGAGRADEPFIHQILCNDREKRPAVTLHCYRAPTDKRVEQLFSSTFQSESYLYVIDKEGNLSTEAW